MADPLVGSSQAQAMLRRVSPEGRARALREHKRLQKRRAILLGKLALALLLIGGALFAYDTVFGGLSPSAISIAAVALVAAIFGSIWTSRERGLQSPSRQKIALPHLPQATGTWLEARSVSLPQPCETLALDIAKQIEAMEPQVTHLNPGEPAAHSVQRLLAVELPALLDRHALIPEQLRHLPQSGGQSANDHLQNGLEIVRAEVSRMTEQLALGDFDSLATQDRFLELKYQSDAISNC